MDILGAFRRARLRRQLNKYLTPEIALELTRSGQTPTPQYEPQHFQYMLVHIHDEDIAKIPKAITKVVEAFISRHATITDISSSLVIGLLAVPNPKYDSIEARAGVVESILMKNGKTVRIVHGECDGLVGNFGTGGCWSYGTIIPEFSVVLKKLLDIEFGTAVEITSK